MEGFEVISINDEKCIGHVVERSGDNLIVEHGHLRHHKNALPLAFAEIDEANERVTTTLSAHMVHESPAVNGDGVDERQGGGVLRARRRRRGGLRRHERGRGRRRVVGPADHAGGRGACGRAERGAEGEGANDRRRAGASSPACSATERPRGASSRGSRRATGRLTSVSRSVSRRPTRASPGP